MKKTLLSLAFVAAGIFAFSASAQEPCCNPAQTCCEQTQAPGNKAKFNPFEGLSLTAEQQTAVNELNAKYAKGKKEKRDDKRKEARDARKNYLNDLKAILTPDQYTAYLENMALNNPSPRAKAHQAPRDKKGSKKGPKKGPKQATPQGQEATAPACCQ